MSSLTTYKLVNDIVEATDIALRTGQLPLPLPFPEKPTYINNVAVAHWANVEPRRMADGYDWIWFEEDLHGEWEVSADFGSEVYMRNRRTSIAYKVWKRSPPMVERRVFPVKRLFGLDALLLTLGGFSMWNRTQDENRTVAWSALMTLFIDKERILVQRGASSMKLFENVCDTIRWFIGDSNDPR